MKWHRAIAGLFGYEMIRKRKLGHLLPASHLKIVLDALHVDCVIDVGANRGQYAAKLRELGYRGRILSFEPVAESYARLAEAAAGDRGWELFNYALGGAAGEREINVTESSAFASFYAPNEYSRARFGGERVAVKGVERVAVKRLDEVYDELIPGAARAFLKMDTQGHDLEVFRGAAGVLERIVGLQSELAVRRLYEGMPDFLESLAAYREHGFEITGLYPVSRDHATQVVIEYDCIMRRIR